MRSPLRPAVVAGITLASIIACSQATDPGVGGADGAGGTAAAPATANAAPPGAQHPGPRFDEGVHLGLYGYDKPAWVEQGLTEIADLGANAVAIMVAWVTPDIRSVELHPTGEMTPSDEVLRQAVRMARSLGLRVFLMPFVYVEAMAPGEWRGTIAPPEWGLWFARYEEFILHYARIAREEGVDLFSVGSELCSSERHTERWTALIARVREVFPGRLTYSLNWDHLDAMKFGSSLDVVGMNAYFELSTKGATPGVEELVKAWGPIVDRLRSWRQNQGRSLVLTEIGYPSRAGAAADPWNYGVDRDPAPDEQFDCYEAFRRVWGSEQGLEGVYFYRWWGEGGPRDTGYTPKGKPAAGVLRSWFGRR